MNIVFKSILINYKSWIIFLLAIFYINIQDKSLWILFLNTFNIFIFPYISHYFFHWKYAYPYNISHTYHHFTTGYFSHFIQIILEFVVSLFPIYFKYLLSFQYNYDLIFVNEWLAIFIYIVYTTVHNINYSYFHVNNVHELHHKTMLTNYGFDIFDIIFGTKYVNEHNGLIHIENTDHYIGNILIGYIIVRFLQFIWTTTNKKTFYINILYYLYTFIFCILVGFTIQLFLEDINTNFNNEIIAFKNLLI